MSHHSESLAYVSHSFVPERQFWLPKYADMYLDDDGLPKRKGEFEPRTIPLIDDKNYPLVDMYEFINDLRSLFVAEYRFPKLYLKGDVVIKVGDNVDHLQPQHQYNPMKHSGNERPYEFCDSPDRKAEVPFLFHQTRNHYYDDPRVVDEYYRQLHTSTMQLCTDALYKSAHAIRSQTGVRSRLKSVKKGSVEPKDKNDTEGKRYVYSRRESMYQAFSRSIGTLVEAMPEGTPYSYLKDDLIDAKPFEAFQTLSTIVPMGRHWDMRAYIRHGDESILSDDPRVNPRYNAIQLTQTLPKAPKLAA